MQKKNKKKLINKTLITTILLITLNTSCSTNKHKNHHIIKTLELQNAVIKTTINDRTNTETKTLIETNEQLIDSEVLLLSALVSVKKSNNVLIKKLKPVTKRKCNCEKN